MKLDNYSPTFRNVLIKELEKEEKTAGGIYIPPSLLSNDVPDEKQYKVVKVGKECTMIQINDIVYLTRGVYPEPVGDYFSVMEMQIKGYERSN